MSNALMSKHLADKIGVHVEVDGNKLLPYIGEDGQCYISTVGGPVVWDLFADTELSARQRIMTFIPWARSEGLPLDPAGAAIATGFAA